MNTTKIRDFAVIDGNHVMVTASVHHARNTEVNPKDVMVSLHNETQGKLSAVAGSFVKIGNEPVRTLVQGVMSLSHAVLPVSDNMEKHGFKAIASNIFMDQDENIWNVEEAEGGKVAVRSNTIDNPDELQGLLAKCSTEQVAGTDPFYFESVASAQVDAPESGSFCTFVQEGKTVFGVVVSSVFETEDPRSYTGEVVVLANGADQPTKIDDKLLVANAGHIDYPEVEELESAAAGNVGKSQIDQMVDYYRKVFGHSPEFFAQLEQRIRKHTFA